MILRAHPGQALSGEMVLPGDKSLSHRAALLSALADGESRIENFLVAGVTKVMLEALSELYISWTLEDTVLKVQGMGWDGLRPPNQALDCGHSATTMRFLAGALAGAGIAAVLDGSAALRRRPMGRIIEPLRQMGASIEPAPGGGPPLSFSSRPQSRPLRAINFELAIASAQVKSAILLAALRADGETIVCEPGPSRDHTERLLSAMGAQIDHPGEGCIRLRPSARPLKPLTMSIPGDFSSAAFLLVAALITPGSNLTLRNVGLNPTRTGLLEALMDMGARIEIRELGEAQSEPVGDIAVRHSTLAGTQVDGPLVVRMIDEFPAFAIAAAFAQGRTDVNQAADLRHKETDRIGGLCEQLRDLGVKLEEREDGFSIYGGSIPSGGTVQALGDHRLAMALAVAGLGARATVEVMGAEIIAQSYPHFDMNLRKLGAEVERCPTSAIVSG